MSSVEFDELFQYLGTFGKVQRNVLLVYSLSNLLFAWVYFGQMFMTLTPPHNCKLNYTTKNHQWNLNETAWHKQSSRNGDTINSDRCSEIHNNSTIKIEYDLVVDELLPESVPCSRGWTYDYTDYYPTITSQMDWVCENDWLPPLAQLIFFAGALLGTICFGYFADKYGRVPVHLAVNIIGGIAGIASSFSWSFLSFAICRFVVGMSLDWCFMSIYILILEYVPPGHRSMAACVPAFIFFTSGFCSLPWIAKVLGDWKWLGFLLHSSQLVLAAGALLVPESSRWLLSKGRGEEAITILTSMADNNNKSIPKDVIKKLKETKKNVNSSKLLKVSCTDLLKTPVLRRRFLSQCIIWCSMTVGYDVYLRYSEHLVGSSVFMDFTLAGLMELPGGILPLIAMEKIGRKMTAVTTFFVLSASGLSIVWIMKEQHRVILGITLVGRIAGSVLMNLMHQYSVELLPTVARGQGLAALVTVSKLSVLVSPYIVYLEKYGHWIPYIVIFPLTLVSAFAAMYLPETLHQKLPDTLADGETFMTHAVTYKRRQDSKLNVESHENKGFEESPVEL